VHEDLRAAFREVFGDDIYIEPDSQDGQWLAIQALALHDAYSFAVATYNAFSPSTAQGVGLSRVVKINGIARHTASFSFADIVLTGQAGATITGGIVSDEAGNRWIISDAVVVIPPAGEITVSAVCEVPGAVFAPAGSIVNITTPTRGWQSVTNIVPAVPGNPVETDAALRARQTVSTMIPSQTILEGIIGAVASLPGVTRYKGYENDTYVTDVNGIPPQALSFVVEGGDATDIAATIAAKKSPGVATYGTTSVTVFDAYGIPRDIKFYRPTNVEIDVEVSLTALAGYSQAIEDSLVAAIVDWINALAIGEDVIRTRMYVPANLDGTPASKTYVITNLRIARHAAALGTTDLVIAFNEAAVGLTTNVTLVLA
jgi:uncharacterized phage protein gp47/JayE